MTARIDDPLQADLADYNNLVVTLDNDKQELQTGAPGSAGGWAGVGSDADTQVVDIDLPGAWVHEVDHNVGGLHCKNDDPDETGYNFGHSVREGRGTAMCGNDLAYYSSPLVRDDEGNILGSANDADMAQVWRERMAEMAAKRIHTVPYDVSSSKSSSSKSNSSANNNTGVPTIIQNYWLADQSLNIEHGKLESSSISPSLLSGQWIFEPIAGTPYVRIKNRQDQKQFLHIEYGKLTSASVGNGWWSAMWKLNIVK